MRYKYEVVYSNKEDKYATVKIFKHRILALLYYCYIDSVYDFAYIRRRTWYEWRNNLFWIK